MPEKYTPGMFISSEAVTQYLMSFDPTREIIPPDAAEEISTFYEAEMKRIDEELETYNRDQKPIHPESGEVATFLGYMRTYPVYKTPSGHYLMRKRKEYFPITPTSPNAESELRPTLRSST